MKRIAILGSLALAALFGVHGAPSHAEPFTDWPTPSVEVCAVAGNWTRDVSELAVAPDSTVEAVEESIATQFPFMSAEQRESMLEDLLIDLMNFNFDVEAYTAASIDFCMGLIPANT